jgi:hypothetical protein
MSARDLQSGESVSGEGQCVGNRPADETGGEIEAGAGGRRMRRNIAFALLALAYLLLRPRRYGLSFSSHDPNPVVIGFGVVALVLALVLLATSRSPPSVGAPAPPAAMPAASPSGSGYRVALQLLMAFAATLPFWLGFVRPRWLLDLGVRPSLITGVFVTAAWLVATVWCTQEYVARRPADEAFPLPATLRMAMAAGIVLAVCLFPWLLVPWRGDTVAVVVLAMVTIGWLPQTGMVGGLLAWVFLKLTRAV